MQKVYTVKELVEVLNIGYQTVLKLIREGRIKAFKQDGKKLITQEAIEAFKRGE